MGVVDIKDSGKRQEFSTGAVRDTSEGKGRYDLLPPRAVREVARHFEAGAKKYAERNWEKGIPLARFLDSGIRHAFAALQGDDDENHAAAAAWNLLCFLETRARIRDGYLPAELDNLPKLRRVAAPVQSAPAPASTASIPVVYVAGPFRGANAWEIEQNIRRAEALALEVWKLGCAAISPHANTRFFQGAADDSVWLDGDLEIVARCDAVLFTPDWKRSSGATAEHQFAIERGVPVLFSLDELTQWLAGRQDGGHMAKGVDHATVP